MRVAAIDMGTNSTRMLVADVAAGRAEAVRRESRVTGLGRGVEISGKLSTEALESHIAWDPGALAVSRMMAKSLDATLVHQRFSRLVYDCNRPPDSPGAMPETSEVYPVPGNAALSPEAHAALSIAMNRMGARSNSGEGGEDPLNYHPLPNGDRIDNRVKQVASARFGVTAEYPLIS